MKLTTRSISVPTAMAVALMLCGSSHAAATSDAALAARTDRVLAATPLIDGHNDLPWEIRTQFGNAAGVDLSANTASLPLKAKDGETPTPLMTDIPRLRAGHVGRQFWLVWIPTYPNGSTLTSTPT